MFVEWRYEKYEGVGLGYGFCPAIPLITLGGVKIVGSYNESHFSGSKASCANVLDAAHTSQLAKWFDYEQKCCNPSAIVSPGLLGKALEIKYPSD